MSYAIAVRWVHIDGQRTSYTQALNEAAHLCGELAELRARALALGTDDAPDVPHPPELVDLKGEDALLEWISRTRTELPDLRARLEAAARRRLSARLGPAQPPRADAAARLARTRGHTRPDLDTERASALTRAHDLIDANAGEIDPADHPGLTERLAELAEATTAAALRTAGHALETALHQAVQRHRAHLRTERLRQRMRGQTADLDPAQRHRLLQAIDTAADPAAIQPDLDRTRDAAHARRARHDIARAAAQALAEIGCEVTPHTDTELARTGETTAALTERPGYALRLRLPHDRARLSTSLVRAPAQPPEHDEAAQRWFCETKQPLLTRLLTRAAHPHHLHETLRREPGDRPLPVAEHPRPAPPAEHEIPATPRRHRAR